MIWITAWDDRREVLLNFYVVITVSNATQIIKILVGSKDSPANISRHLEPDSPMP
jgi:hypothetical protein